MSQMRANPLSSSLRAPFQQPPTEESNPTIAALLLKSLAPPGAEELEELTVYFNHRVGTQKEYIESWYELQDTTFSKYERYKSEFQDQNRQAENNNSRFLKNVESSSLLKRDFSLDLESELKKSEHEELLGTDWFNQFKKYQTTQFTKLLHEIAKKVITNRFTSAQQETRKNLESSIQKQMQAIEKCKTGRGGDNINPYFKHYLTELSLLIAQLQKIDNIVPKILKDLQARPKEYAKEVAPLLKSFSEKMQAVFKEFEHNTYKDAGNRSYYANIDREDSDKVRSSHYGFHLVNRDLATLKLGRIVHPIVVNFYLRFLKEKTDQMNARAVDSERIYINENVFDLYRGESLLLGELGNEGGNILKNYKRTGFVVSVDDKHMMLVEVRKTEDEFRKELIIYNSDIEKHQMFHTKIYDMFRTCMGLEQPDRLAVQLNYRGTDSFSKSGAFGTSSISRVNSAGASMGGRTQVKMPVGHVLDVRIANCPQQVNQSDSAMYACKNAGLLCLNKKIMQGIYSQTDINEFRYEIFNVILKIGNDVEVDLLEIEH